MISGLIHHLSNLLLNEFTEGELTIPGGKLFQILDNSATE